MKRIMIIGASGSGKSTLARLLGESTGLPVVHIDPMFFYEGWVQRPKEETERLAREAAQTAEWIFEGNFSTTIDQRAELADLIVLLELGKLRRVSRTLLRTIRYLGRTRPDMAKGCPERFSWDFHFDWVWNYDTHSRPKMDEFVNRWQGKRPILTLSSAKEAREFGREPWAVLKAKGFGGLEFHPMVDPKPVSP